MGTKSLEYDYRSKDEHIRYLLQKRFEIEFKNKNLIGASLIVDNLSWLYPNEKTAVKYKEDLAEAYYKRGLALTKIGESTGNVKKYEEACKYYEKAAEYKEDHAEAYSAWGFSLSMIGELTGNVKKYEEACKYYEKAAEYNRGFRVMNNWRYTLSRIEELSGSAKKSG